MVQTQTIPCYYINLDRSPERDTAFKEQCRALGIVPTRVAGIDGKKVPAETAAAMGPRTSGEYGVGYGEIGCFLSHVKVWEIVASGSSEWAFVCEDDIHFSTDAGKFLQNADWLPPDSDLVKAETVFQRVLVDKRRGAGAFGHNISRLRSTHGGTAGYFVSRDGAENLLRLTVARCDPVDQLMFNPRLGIAQQLTIWQIDPALCVQDYLVVPSDKHAGFTSVVNSAQFLFHPDGGKTAKPRGFDRRVIQPLRKLGAVIRRVQTNAFTDRHFRRIPIKLGDQTFEVGRAGRVS